MVQLGNPCGGIGTPGRGNPCGGIGTPGRGKITTWLNRTERRKLSSYYYSLVKIGRGAYLVYLRRVTV
jgi:hypothetical protein